MRMHICCMQFLVLMFLSHLGAPGFVSRQGTDGKIFTRWQWPRLNAAKRAAKQSKAEQAEQGCAHPAFKMPLPRPVQRFTQLCAGDAVLGQRLFDELRKDLREQWSPRQVRTCFGLQATA